MIRALRAAAKAEGAIVEVVAPAIGGVLLDDGTVLPADQMVGGGPSVLYDAVAIVTSEAGAASLARLAPAKDFVSDAHAHCKLVGHSADAAALLAAAGVDALMDDGYHELTTKTSATRFLAACRALRWWDRS